MSTSLGRVPYGEIVVTNDELITVIRNLRAEIRPLAKTDKGLKSLKSRLNALGVTTKNLPTVEIVPALFEAELSKFYVEEDVNLDGPELIESYPAFDVPTSEKKATAKPKPSNDGTRKVGGNLGKKYVPHGKRFLPDGFNAGDRVSYLKGGRIESGVLTHANFNNYTKNGYGYIRPDLKNGPIERAIGKFWKEGTIPPSFITVAENVAETAVNAVSSVPVEPETVTA